jgi:hypothetical protein
MAHSWHTQSRSDTLLAHRPSGVADYARRLLVYNSRISGGTDFPAAITKGHPPTVRLDRTLARVKKPCCAAPFPVLFPGSPETGLAPSRHEIPRELVFRGRADDKVALLGPTPARLSTGSRPSLGNIRAAQSPGTPNSGLLPLGSRGLHPRRGPLIPVYRRCPPPIMIRSVYVSVAVIRLKP